MRFSWCYLCLCLFFSYSEHRNLITGLAGCARESFSLSHFFF